MKPVRLTLTKPSNCRHRHRRRASALLAVYWLIALLSLGVFATAQVLLTEVDATADDQQAFRAEQLAAMAVSVAANPAVERGDPLLRQQLSDVESFEGRILSEGGRLHLNALLLSGNRLVLERLFGQWGLDHLEAVNVVDALIDWVDPDDIPTGDGGAENLDYAEAGLRDRPYNQGFRTLDEALMVSGMHRVAALNPGWRDAFTLFSSGRLDLNEAAPGLIQAMFGCTPETALHFVETRAGRDGIPHTEDDLRIETVEEALALLGSSGPEADLIAGLVAVDDPVTRLVGIGQVDRLAVEQTIVVSNRSGNPVWLDYKVRRLKSSSK